MRHTTNLRRAGVAATLPLAFLLAACGGGESDPSAAQDDTSVVDETSEKSDDDPDAKRVTTSKKASEPSDPTSAATNEPDAPSEGDGPSVGDAEPGTEITAAEFVQLFRTALDKATTATVTLAATKGDLEVSAEGVIDLTGSSPALQGTLSSSALPDAEGGALRLLDDTAYVNLGAMSGHKYIKMDLGELSMTGLGASQLDPDLLLEEFEKAATAVTYRGTESVDGESLHGYDVALDPRRTNSQRVPKGAKPSVHTVWFDDAGLLRRLAMSAGTTYSTQVDYRDWGKPVSISAPPADEVIERR